MRPFFLIAGICLLMLVALAGHLYGSTHGNRVSRHVEITNRDYSITISRSGCYGDCPIYTLQIDGNGHTRLMLEALAPREKGKEELVELIYESRVTEPRRKAIVALAEAGGFRSLDLDYSRGNPDLERRTIMVGTPRGRWSTSVYGIPCKSESAQRRGNAAGDDTATVPDVFCALESELHRVACDTLSDGKRTDRVRGVAPIQPLACRS